LEPWRALTINRSIQSQLDFAVALSGQRGNLDVDRHRSILESKRVPAGLDRGNANPSGAVANPLAAFADQYAKAPLR
jgi:hypothetical protein